jgi:predicted dehydrogenase
VTRSGGPRLRSAVVGTGFVGPHHVDAIRRGGYADVVALVGSDEERSRARARALGVDRGTADLVAVLADPTIDVVHVCTPNVTHEAIGTAALEAGKHVVIEKPIAVDVVAGRRMADLARRLGLHGAVAMTYRGYPMVREARAIVAGGQLGELRLAHGGYIQDWLTDSTAWNWRIDPVAGGPSRAIADIGTHWFDTVEFISGRRVDAVLADLATFIETRHRPLRETRAFDPGSGGGEPVPVVSEDAATLLLRFHGGARGTFLVSQVSPGRKNAFSVELAGASRSLRWEQEDPERLWLGDPTSWTVLRRDPAGGADASAQAEIGIPALPAGHPEGWGEALRDVLRPFYAAIAAGEPAPAAGAEAAYPTLDDGVRGVAFVDAALASARKGGWVKIPGLRRP